MSIIGGYFSTENPKIPVANLLSRLAQFKDFSLDSEQEAQIFEYEFGHLFCIGNKQTRSLVSSASDNNGNIFLSLGYLDEPTWSNWDFTNSSINLSADHLGYILDDIENFEGEFAAFFYHHASQCLHIMNDRFAARALFYCKTEDGFFFCSNFVLLLKISALAVHFDPMGLLQIFHFGHPIDTYTHILGIKRLFPATHLYVRRDDFQEKKYWHLKYEPDYEINPTCYAEAVFDTFKESTALRANIAGNGTLALSGGLDSRLIAATIPKNSNFTCCTFNSTDDVIEQDYRVASQIANILRFKHITTTINPGIISNSAWDLALTTGGLIQFQHAVKNLELINYIKSEGYDLSLDGTPGDVLVGSYIPSIYYAIPTRMLEFCERFTTINNRIEIDYFFQKDFVSSYFKRFSETFKESIAQDRGPTAAHRISAWKMLHRQAPKTFANPAHCYPYMTSLRPHLGYKYNDLILKLPAAWLYNRAFYQFMIHHCIPQLRNVINANTGCILSVKMCNSQPSWTYYKWRALKRRAGTYLKHSKHKKWAIKNQFELQLIKNDKKLLNDMREILHSNSVFKEIFDVPHYMSYFNAIENSETFYPKLMEPDKPIGSLCGILYFYKYFC